MVEKQRESKRQIVIWIVFTTRFLISYGICRYLCDVFPFFFWHFLVLWFSLKKNRCFYGFSIVFFVIENDIHSIVHFPLCVCFCCIHNFYRISLKKSIYFLEKSSILLWLFFCSYCALLIRVSELLSWAKLMTLSTAYL